MTLPRLTFADKREMAQRYQAGESLCQLAEAYGCGVSSVQYALKQLGVERRTLSEARALLQERLEEDGLRRCRECGKAVRLNAKRDVCPTHLKCFCQDCDAPLPPDWTGKRCSACAFKLRYRHKAPVLCRICGRLRAKGCKRDLCAVHRPWFCAGCDRPMPPTRKAPYCTECERQRKERYLRGEERRCCQCGEGEPTPRTQLCRRCHAQIYEVRRWAALHLDRPCRQCGAALPKGRDRPYCAACQTQRSRKLRAEQQALGAHRCALCHDPLPLSRATYCGGCTHMIEAWRKAWHAGNPVARMLGTVQTRRKWQQEENG